MVRGKLGPITHGRLTVNLEIAQVRELDRMARAKGISMSAIARLAIEKFIENPVLFLAEVHNDNGHSDQFEKAQVAV